MNSPSMRTVIEDPARLKLWNTKCYPSLLFLAQKLLLSDKIGRQIKFCESYFVDKCDFGRQNGFRDKIYFCKSLQ